MRRIVPIAVVLPALAAAAITTPAASAPTLTPSNSVLERFGTQRDEEFRGTGCGATATVRRELPAGSRDIKIVRPAVGARDADGLTRVTDASIAGTTVSITVVADGTAVCDPSGTGTPPAEPVAWNATYEVTTTHSRRIQALVRIYFESYQFGARWAVRPRTVYDARKGAAPGDRFTRLRWSRAGGKIAVATGILRQDYCRKGDRCPQNGKPVRLVARNPKFCKDTGKVEYRDLAITVAGRRYGDNRIVCSR